MKQLNKIGSHTIASVIEGQSNKKNTTLIRKIKQYKISFDRNLLPNPKEYYSKQHPNVEMNRKWIKVNCCFHKPDNNPSLNISMMDGHFKCFACGAKGCDVITYHMLRYKVSFIEAVTFMGAWRHE